MSKILIVVGHPLSESLCAEIGRRYLKGAAAAGHQVKLIQLSELKFNPLLEHGFKQRMKLEPDLQMALDDIVAADHLVFIYPTWWGTLPALLKGFIDRTFLPGITFRYRENSVLWDKLLKGKSARIITTMDSPAWYYKLIYHSPGQNALKHGILNFCGVKPVKSTIFDMVKNSTPEKCAKWLTQVEMMGNKGI
jgi:putative NADPH-quinone reductase